ncbi:MAG: branched-chain amino acid ABC transporter permease [Dehalococcoidia bacterium]
MIQALNDFTTQFWPSTVNGLAAGGIYGLIALGYTMVYGVLRLINFAHGEVFMIGTLSVVFTVSLLNISAPLSGFALVGLLLLLAVVAMAASGGTAALLELVAYRRLRKHGAPRLTALISAIGASLFLQEFAALFIIPNVMGLPGKGRDNIAVPERFMDKEVLFSIGDAGVRNDKLLIFIVAIVMMVVLDQFVNRTKIGRGIRATAQDPETAVLMGVNIDRIVVMTFLVGGAAAGFGASLYVLQFENTKFFVGFILGVKAFTAAVLGGIGNLRGALVGGFAIGLIEMYGSSVFGSHWADVIVFTILVLVLMFRPTGILGESLQQARA